VAEGPQHLAIFENLLLKECILSMLQLKFSLKTETTFRLGREGASPLGHPSGYALGYLTNITWQVSALISPPAQIILLQSKSLYEHWLSGLIGSKSCFNRFELGPKSERNFAR